MVLRSDEPVLYHFERLQAHDVARDVEFVTLVKMYRLLWVVIPMLAAIAFPSVSRYMAILAIVLHSTSGAARVVIGPPCELAKCKMKDCRL